MTKKIALNIVIVGYNHILLEGDEMIKAIQCTEDTLKFFYNYIQLHADGTYEDAKKMLGSYLLISPGEKFDPAESIESNFKKPVDVWLLSKEVFHNFWHFMPEADPKTFSEVRSVGMGN